MRRTRTIASGGEGAFARWGAAVGDFVVARWKAHRVLGAGRRFSARASALGRERRPERRSQARSVQRYRPLPPRCGRPTGPDARRFRVELSGFSDVAGDRAVHRRAHQAGHAGPRYLSTCRNGTATAIASRSCRSDRRVDGARCRRVRFNREGDSARSRRKRRIRSVRFSPDGSRIVYERVDGPKSTIWVCDSAGNNPRQLTDEGFESFPDINRDRRVVAGRQGNSLRVASHGLVGSLVRADRWRQAAPAHARCSQRPKRLLVERRKMDRVHLGSWKAAGHMGRAIRGRAGAACNRHAGGGGWDPALQARHCRAHIHVATAPTRHRCGRAMPRPARKRASLLDSIRTSWFNTAPDGKSVQLRDRARRRHRGSRGRADRRGRDSHAARLAAAPCRGPLWSPDGSKIAFGSDRAGIGDIWVIDAAGGAPRALTSWPGFEQNPAWSADGATVDLFPPTARLGSPTSGRSPQRAATPCASRMRGT